MSWGYLEGSSSTQKNKIIVELPFFRSMFVVTDKNWMCLKLMLLRRLLCIALSLSCRQQYLLPNHSNKAKVVNYEFKYKILLLSFALCQIYLSIIWDLPLLKLLQAAGWKKAHCFLMIWAFNLPFSFYFFLTSFVYIPCLWCLVKYMCVYIMWMKSVYVYTHIYMHI